MNYSSILQRPLFYLVTHLLHGLAFSLLRTYNGKYQIMEERNISMQRKKIVVALGHRALGNTLPEQQTAAKRTAKSLADLVEAGADIAITHSNAPQVGMIHTAMNEFQKAHTDYTVAPMSVCSATNWRN